MFWRLPQIGSRFLKVGVVWRKERDLSFIRNVIRVSKHKLKTIILFDLHKGQLLTEKSEL